MPQFTEWFRDNGDATHRVNYDLNPDSVVVDLGGYEGHWAGAIAQRYGCTVLVFEPIPHFMEGCKHYLRFWPKVDFFPFAIGDKDGEQEITLAADSSSIFGGGAGAPTVKIKTISPAHFLAKIPAKVDLIKINIEGGEYPLLAHILAARTTAERFRDIQVQFHTFVPGAAQKRENLRQVLAYTHHPTYDYDFVWENWRRNGG